MKLEEYQTQATRTLPDLGSYDKNIEHMDLGILTELCGEILDIFKKKVAYGKEIDVVNLREETADVAWYVANKCTISDIRLSHAQMIEAYEKYFEFTVTKAIENKEERIFAQGLVMSMAVSVIDQDNMFRYPLLIMSGLHAINVLFGGTLEEQLTKNIEKLKVRYPDKFDTDKAINRNLEEERKMLE